MHTTNYRDTLVTVSPDSPVAASVVPGKPGAIATLQHGMLDGRPYAMTSDDLLFAVYAARHPGAEREAFFSKPQACLRASPLVKQFGWGIHHDGEGRIAMLAVESAEYRALVADAGVKKTPGMRSRR